MRNHLALTAAAFVTAVALTACSNGDDADHSETPVEAPTTSQGHDDTETSVAPMQTVKEAPDVAEGKGKETAEAVAQNFLENWVVFSPSNLEPKDDWFASWDKWASADFREKMRYKADGMWSWTWNQSKKACCVSFPSAPETVAGEDVAASKITLKRYTMDLMATAKDLEAGKGSQEEEKTYLVEMVATDDSFKVIDAYEVEPDYPLPEVQ